MVTPAIKDQTLVLNSTYVQGLATKEPVLNPSGTPAADYYRGDKTWQPLNKAAVGLNNVDNTTDANKPVSTATATALGNKINSSEKGAVNGVATLGADQKVPAAQLPSYVDDVIEIATKAALPGVGESGKIYLVLADESRNGATEQYRWSGSVFTRIPTSPGSTDEVTEGATRLYFTENRVRAAILTGLSLATNAAITAADSVLSALGKLQKQLSDLAIDVLGKEPSIAAGSTSQYLRGDKTWQSLPVAATNQAGIAQLNDTVTSTSTTQAATANAVKAAYDRGDIARDVPSNPQSVASVIAATDRGKSIDTIANVTVPSDAVAINIGQVTTITNLSATPITIIQDAGVTLRLAGTALTGNRTLAGYGMVTVRKAGSNLWYISGAGIS